MKIRFFNAYDTTTPFFIKLIPYLASLGWEIELIISQTKYKDKPELENELIKYSNVKLIQTIGYGKIIIGRLQKIVVLILYSIYSAIYSLFGEKSDINIFLTQPPLFYFWGYVLSMFRKQPYFCVIMDLYPDIAINLGLIKNSIVSSILKEISTFVLSKSMGIIVIGRCMSEYVERKGISSNKIHIIPNWADENQKYQLNNSMFKIDYGVEDRFVVMYAGNIGNSQYFDDIFYLTKFFQEEKFDGIKFVFIGDGSKKNQIQEMIERDHLSNVLLLPYIKEKYSLSEILSAGDIHFVSLKESITGLAVPSKAYNILAAGRPIIYQGNKKGEIARMVAEEGVGTVVDIGDVNGLKSAIMNYYDNPELCKKIGEKGKALIDNKYNSSIALEKYSRILLKKIN